VAKGCSSIVPFFLNQSPNSLKQDSLPAFYRGLAWRKRALFYLTENKDGFSNLSENKENRISTFQRVAVHSRPGGKKIA
jgi:hypothetical protein